ncbi:MAG: sigma-70 family RNA polymerase sigma factor [Bacteroidetes bacterium]|nr:sigma-70 family RNA polymerase sigma factor [Bacteroidota bacterium]
MSGTINNNILNPEKWIDNYADFLYNFICCRVNDKIHAKDIVQDIFLSAWKGKDQYKGEASEKSWLVSICKNKITDYYRKQAKELTQYLTEFENHNDYFDAEGSWDKVLMPKAWQVSADDSIENKELRKVLAECYKKLQQLQFAVFSMKYIDDMESDEICKVLDISSSNYWVLVHRAKLQLRACLEKNWFYK